MITKSGVTFDEQWHTEDDWKLKPVRIYISMPEVKEQKIDIPGGDGTIDLTEINGRPSYGMRRVELEYDLPNINNQEWHEIFSEIGAAIAGRKIKMVLDDEPDHYYMVRLKVDGEKTDYINGEITLSGTAEPFKFDLQSSGEPWKWDIFNFHTGVIRQLMDIQITGSNRTVKILGAGEPFKFDLQSSGEPWKWDIFNFHTGVIRQLMDIQITGSNRTVKILGAGIDCPPVFAVTEANSLKLTHGGRTYTLKVGRNRFPAVRVGKEDVTLQFSGAGKLTIEYRGQYL